MIRSFVSVAFLFSILTPVFTYAQIAPESECMLSEHDYYGVGMTRAQAEQAYRKAMRQEFPDMEDTEFEVYAQYGMRKQRERVVRRQATCIRIKDKYPNLSRKERELLMQDELARSQAAEEPRGVGVPDAPPVFSCTQMRLGAFSSIDCY